MSDYDNGYAAGRDSMAWQGRKIEQLEAEVEQLVAEVEHLRNENQCCRDEIAQLREVKIAAVNVTECLSSQLPEFLEELEEALAHQPEKDKSDE